MGQAVQASKSGRTQARSASGRYTPPKRKQRVTRVALGGLGLTGLVVPGLIAGASPASAITAVSLYVTSGGTGDCTATTKACGSIQTAITRAQGSAYSGNDVTVNVGAGTFTEHDTIDATGLASLAIAGAGAASTIVNGGKAGSVFTVGASAIPVTISKLTITNGRGAAGGGIKNAGKLTIDSATISGNTTGAGATGSAGYYGHLNGAGGASSAGGNGGGIENSGTLTIASSTISGNTTGAGGTGGAGANFGATFGPLDGIYSCVGCSGGDGTDGSAGGNGGGIDNSGTLTIASSTIAGNTTGAGGSGGNGGAKQNIDTTGYVTLPISAGAGGAGGTGGHGGGIMNTGKLSITAATISGNVNGPGGNSGAVDASAWSHGGSAGNGGNGGGIANSGTLTIASSTISGNTTGYGGLNRGWANHGVGGHGGGIMNTGTLSITAATISWNATGKGGNVTYPAAGVPGKGGNGGGIANYATLTVASSTISGNTTSAGGNNLNYGNVGPAGNGGGIINSGTAKLSGTIVANSASGGDCSGGVTDAGYNITDTGSCGFSGTGSINVSGTLIASLGALAANGGPTQTILLSSTSPAIGAIPNGTAGLCPTTDQRGVTVATGVNCAIGAVQVAPTLSQTVSFTSRNPSTVVVGGTTYSPIATSTSGLAVAISLAAASTGCTIAGGIVSFTGAGSCVINAKQPGAGLYLAAAQVQQSIVVSWGQLSAALSAPTFNPVPVAASTSYAVTGKLVLDCPVGTACATTAPVLPGSTISVSGGGSTCQPSALTYSGASTSTTSGDVLQGYGYTCSLTSPAAGGTYTVTVSFTGATVTATTGVTSDLNGF